MKEQWNKIEQWLNANCPEIIPTLNKGAVKKDFDKLEITIGLSLPSGFREFYAVHNGQSRTSRWFLDGGLLLSIDDIIMEWSQWKKMLPGIDENCLKQFGVPAKSLPASGIKDDWWNAGWVPFTSNDFGDFYCLDLNPANEGKTGQVISMWHDDPQRELISPSFGEWIDSYISDMESGIYVKDPDEGGVIRKEYLE